MGSGIFPLERNDPDWDRLKKIADDLQRVSEQLRDCALEQDQTDNILSDGGYIRDLYQAIACIRGVME